MFDYNIFVITFYQSLEENPPGGTRTRLVVVTGAVIVSEGAVGPWVRAEATICGAAVSTGPTVSGATAVSGIASGETSCKALQASGMSGFAVLLSLVVVPLVAVAVSDAWAAVT